MQNQNLDSHFEKPFIYNQETPLLDIILASVNVSKSTDNDLISSKEILRIKGISRATLNNYIKMGLIPSPIVQKPKSDMKGIKKIGYFPYSVLERIEMVQQLKKEGNSLEEISRTFSEVWRREGSDVPTRSEHESQNNMISEREQLLHVYDKELKVTLEDVSFPAYLLNYNFEIEWVNHAAENRIFKELITLIRDVESRNIFKLLFHWEFHSVVQNWKDLVIFHMAIAKIRFAKTWISNLYKGISQREIKVLEEIYEGVSGFPEETVTHSHISFLMKDGATKSYCVYNIFFKEGILFVYAPESTFYQRA